MKKNLKRFKWKERESLTLQQCVLNSCQLRITLKLNIKRLKRYTWGLNLNQGKDSKEIDPLANKEDSLKIEGRDPSQEIDIVIPRTNSIKIQDLDTIDPTEGKMTKHDVIDRDLRPLLDALDAGVIDVMRM